MKFLDYDFKLEDSNVVIFGVKIFEEVSKSLRETSRYLEEFDIDKRKNLLENIKIADIGDLNLKTLEDITFHTKKIIKLNKVPLIISGDHPSLFSMQAFDRNTKIISFDAHCDLKNEYEDEKIIELSSWDGNFNSKVNGATWLRRLSEIINTKNILLLGIRSCDESELEYIEKNKISYFTSKSIKENLDYVKKAIEDFTEDSKLYFTIDLDVFDPSIAPAVHYPEPNGLFFSEFQKLIQSIKGKLVGMDICALNPIPNNRITEFLAIRTIFEILSLI